VLGGAWATDNLTRTVFALGFEIEMVVEDGVFAVSAILLSGERVVLNTFDSEDEAHARIRELGQTLRAVNV